MDPINSPVAEKTIVQAKSTGGVELVEKTSSTDVSDTNTGTGFDGLTDTECQALEKRRMYLNLAQASFG